MELKYDGRSKKIYAAQYSIGADYGDKFDCRPIYMIRCTCGYPLKAFFAGTMPLSETAMYEFGFSNYGYGAVYTLINFKKQGWGFAIRNDVDCPGCHDRKVIDGPSPGMAVENFLRQRYGNEHSKIAVKPRRLKGLVKRIETDNELQKFFTFQCEEIANRPDVLLITKGGGYYDTDHDEMFKKFELDWPDEKKWFKKGGEDHTDLETEILAAHDEDCTCSLCME